MNILRYKYTGEVNFDGFDEICEIIQKNNNINTLVLCNNGYQRSIIFLCYYLMYYTACSYEKRVSETFPDVKSALKLILNKVYGYYGRNYTLLHEYNEMISKYFNKS